MDLDAFLQKLPANYLENRDKIVLTDNECGSPEQTDEEFRVSGDSNDDEDTIMEQEKNERKLDHKKEIEELNVSALYF